MDKNSVIGFVLIAAIMFGFTFVNSKKQKEIAKQQAQIDSIATVQAIQAALTDTCSAVLPLEAATTEQSPVYKDSSLEAASKALESIAVLENENVRIEFSTKGASFRSVQVKGFTNYDKSDLYIIRPGKSEYSFSLYTGEYIQTKDFCFDIVSSTDSSLVMRLPFRDSGYIEQRFFLPKDGYMVQNELAFVGMEGIIPRNVGSIDLDYSITIPRMEKGFKNESQYSKIDFYYEGDKKPVEIGRSRNSSKRIDSRLNWFAFQQQFFSAILRAPDQFASGELAVSFFKNEDAGNDLMNCTAKMRIDLQHGQNVVIPFEFYFGPNHFQTLKSYEQKYEKIIPLGGWLVGWFTRFVIIPMFNFFNRFIDNFGIIILLMTLVIKTVVLPFTNKSFLSSAKMAALKPEIEKINARYPKQEDAMKKQQATMEFYKRAGVSPMGGCLPTLITLPILWAMFRFFPASIELRQQSFLWCKDLSAYDSILDYGTRIPIFGDHLSLFALLMAATMFIYSKMTMANQPTGNDPSAKSMQFMSVWMMPIMMFFICNNLSAALSYYYLLSQLYGIVQNWILKKYFVNKDELLAKVKASEGKPLPKSKWQKRLEEAQKMQQQQLNQRNKR